MQHPIKSNTLSKELDKEWVKMMPRAKLAEKGQAAASLSSSVCDDVAKVIEDLVVVQRIREGCREAPILVDDEDGDDFDPYA